MYRKFPLTGEIYISCKEELSGKKYWITPKTKNLFFTLDSMLEENKIFHGTYVWYWYKELYFYDKDIMIIRKMLNPDTISTYKEIYLDWLHTAIVEMFRTIEFRVYQAQVEKVLYELPKDYMTRIAKTEFASYNGLIGWCTYREATSFYTQEHEEGKYKALQDTARLYRIKGGVKSIEELFSKIERK